MTGLEGSVAWGPTVRLAAIGDRVAFARIVRACHGDMTRVAYVVAGGEQALADDAVQSAWSIAWRKLHSIRDPERVKPWLLAVAANEDRQALRRKRRATIVEIEFAGADPAGPDPASTVEEIDLDRSLADLPPEDRTLLALRYVAGFDSTEIGTLTGMSASAVRGRLARLIARLRKELTDV